MLEVTSKEHFFFRPSEPLTRAIAEQNQRLVAESVQRISPADELREEAFEGDESEREPIATAYPGREPRRARYAPEEQQTSQLQRLMGDRLYHFLATLAESPYAREGGKFSMREYIPRGMANVLGLSAAFISHQPEPEQAIHTRHLLEDFTGEFRYWLVQQHRLYVCAWGEIHLDEEDRLMLQTYAFDETLAEQACGQEVGV